MDVAFAKALLADPRLQAEIERREEKRWLAADDGGLTLLTGLLGRLQAELDQAEMAGGAEPDSAEAAEVVAKFEEMVAEVNGLLEELDAMARRDEDEAAGIEHRAVVHHVVKPQFKPAPSAPKLNPAAPKIERRKVEQKVESSKADPPPAPSSDGDGFKLGRVKFWDQAQWRGVIRTDSGQEFSIAAGAEGRLD